jgi:hypothetical protein
MHINSTEFLELIVENDCYILFEKGIPSGHLKRDFISLMTQDGRALSLSAPQGFRASPIELPRAIFDDFIAASFIKKDGPENSEGRTVFRVTPDGRARVFVGLSGRPSEPNTRKDT